MIAIFSESWGNHFFRFRFEYKSVKRRAARTCEISGFGICSQRAGAEIGSGPDLYTACQVLTSIRTLLAILQNLYVQALLAKYQIIQVCIACQVVNMDGNALLAR